MDIFMHVIVFLLGAIVGSFLNVCICRIPKRKSIVTPRSHCPHCKNFIAWYDNIPLLSYLLLRGKCRFCERRISACYWLIELLTACLFLAIFNHWYIFSFGLVFAYFVLTSLLIVATFIDLRYFIIPDSISLGGIIAGFVFSFLFPELMQQSSRYLSLLQSVIGCVVCGAVLFTVAQVATYLLKKDAMGMGDVKLLGLIGAFLGWQWGLFTIFVASFAGTIVGVLLMIFKGVKWQSRIPFGPYLSVGAIITLFFGKMMIDFYFSLFMFR